MALSYFHVVCLMLSVLSFILPAESDDHGADVVNYDRDTFQSAITDQKHFVMFFAPWCGHCKRLAPTWNELAKIYNNEESSVTIAKVDCTIETALCSDQDVTGYPTLKFYHKSLDDFVRYKGNRDLDSLQKFVEEQVDRTVKDTIVPPVPEEDKDQGPTELTDETFSSVIKQGTHFVKFFAPWCGHCKHLAPTWDDLAKSFAGSKKVTIAKVDCTSSKTVCTDMGVSGYPTLTWFQDGEKVEQYTGGRTHEELKNFVNNKLKELGEASFGQEEEKVPENLVEEPVRDLTDESFESVVAEGLTFVKFFAPWCSHCQRLAPTWEELGAAYSEKPVTIAKVDCTQHKAVCDSQNIHGYPSLLIFQNGVRLEEYNGPRSLEDLKKFVDKFLAHVEL
ncbi:hypothetical protein C0Q70_07851 [Pomacea canaliculata]|uniref:Thioredoxin domain-containing protein n=1 Tax=Pomacea canaliculata TaxID=400727 RepID=A0A2T7PG55_POMCA|nr:thioredoxin domain-containing protein 5-like [Pomacea canaliculata]PVD32417.1 hypothetical protein C0Q70_07851 [Pomacea canaliculata]